MPIAVGSAAVARPLGVGSERWSNDQLHVRAISGTVAILKNMNFADSLLTSASRGENHYADGRQAPKHRKKIPTPAWTGIYCRGFLTAARAGHNVRRGYAEHAE